VRKGIVLAIMGGFAAVACLFGVVIAFGLLLFGGGGSTKPPCDLTGTTSISAIAPPNKKDLPKSGADSIPSNLLPIFQAAQKKYKVPWYVLAGVNRIETDFGRNLNVSSAGAIGWMQFMPATWNLYEVDGDGDGDKQPNDPWDAIFTAANYLHASGAPGNIRTAIFAYNHASWYVDQVLAKARLYAGGHFVTGAPTEVGSKCDEGPLSSTGKATYDDIVGAANQLDQMHVPYSYGGGHVTPARPSAGDSGIGMDCSASVSWVLQHAGFKLPTMVSGHGGFMDWGEPGPGKKVTIYAYSGHVFMKIGDRYFGTSGFGHPEAGTGAAWFTRPLFSGYLAEFGFVARHPHGL
jgi:hypothetical protein